MKTERNLNKQIQTQTQTIQGIARNYQYTYNKQDNKLDSIALPTNDSLTLQRDKLGRMAGLKVVDKKGRTVVQCEYDYYAHRECTTNQVHCVTTRLGGVNGNGVAGGKGLSNGNDSGLSSSNAIAQSAVECTRYVYDENGNIREIRDG